jgi:hypothetical protein
LGTNEGHSSVTHIEILREKLKDCSAVVDMQQEQLDRNAEQLAALRLDAERYRWLRGEFSRPMLEAFASGYDARNWHDEFTQLDAEIDAALNEEAK